MNTRRGLLLVAAVAAAGLPAAVPLLVLGQTPAPPIFVPLEGRHGSGLQGDVRLTPQGNATSVVVTFRAQPITNESLRLVSGSDCLDMRRSAQSIALNPISGRTSQTLVKVPFSSFRSHHFVVDVRNATARAQQAEACAKL